jgi:tRNA pseudouridine38-40 synthase
MIGHCSLKKLHKSSAFTTKFQRFHSLDTIFPSFLLQRQQQRTIIIVPMSEEKGAPSSTACASSSNIPTTVTQSQAKADLHKRKWKGSEDGWFAKKNKASKKSIVDSDIKHARSSFDKPNSGSYASPEMQKFLGITLIHPLKTQDGEEEEEENDAEEEDNGGVGETEKKKVKRKVALLLGFIGSRYSGFQINPNALTVQAELEYALYKAGLISRLNFGYPQKYSWSVSARTDKGVHSCGQVCSLKILLPGNDGKSQDGKTEVNSSSLDSVVELLNTHLPVDIQVMDAIQTIRKFCAKTHRDKVRYQYLIPSFLLCDRQFMATHLTLDDKNIKDWIKIFADGEECTPESKTMLLQLRKLFLSYRVSDEQLERLASVLNQFKGTHPFHNYTRGVSGTDPNAKRFIHSLTVDATYMDSFGIQWIPVCIIGQSFLLNQIRKMISMAVNVARGYVSDSELDQSLQKDCKVKVQIAPPQGLFLDMSFYETYNRKSKGAAELKWSVNEDTPAVRRWKEFKNKILDHIGEEESTQMNFIQYLVLQEYYFGKHRGSEGNGDEVIQEEEEEEEEGDRNSD